MAYPFKEFIPKSFLCFKEGYSWKYFFNDLFAGASVGVIALPLALAFAIASGVPPEKGLFTAIIAGFLISLLGGSRIQIGGPTGAYVVLVYAVMQKHGYDGLALATLTAGFMIFLMGIARFGVLLKFIPHPVIIGFTTGIAVVILSSQVKDFFGLQIDKVPPEFLEKCKLFCATAHTGSFWAIFVAVITLTFIFVLRRYFPKWPGVITAVILATLATYLFQLPLTTIDSKFGEIPRVLPSPALPHFSWELFTTVFPDAVTIALLGAVESLLCAVVADGMTGYKHKSNCELAAQGLANIGSVIFGGIPATGAIARTTANIRLGAKTPVAGMIHAGTLLLLMLFFAPYAGKIPLAALSSVLVFVAWNMSELPHFFEILKGQKGDAAVLLVTFLLTVLIDLAVAVQVGVIFGALIFLKRMTDKTVVEISKKDHVIILEMKGPLFYSVANLLEEATLDRNAKVCILSFSKTPWMDASGIHALKKFSIKNQQKGITLLLSDVNSHQIHVLQKSGLETLIGKENIFHTTDSALSHANTNKDLAFLQRDSI